MGVCFTTFFCCSEHIGYKPTGLKEGVVMIKIKHRNSVICGLNEHSRAVKDMFSSGTFQGVYTEDGSELLDVSYIRKGDSIEYSVLEKLPVRYYGNHDSGNRRLALKPLSCH